MDKLKLLDDNVSNYLSYLAGNKRQSQSISDNSGSTLSGKQFFNDLVIPLEIISEIESIVIKKVKIDGKKEDKENITDFIADLMCEEGD